MRRATEQKIGGFLSKGKQIHVLQQEEVTFCYQPEIQELATSSQHSSQE